MTGEMHRGPDPDTPARKAELQDGPTGLVRPRARGWGPEPWDGRSSPTCVAGTTQLGVDSWLGNPSFFVERGSLFFIGIQIWDLVPKTRVCDVGPKDLSTACYSGG